MTITVSDPGHRSAEEIGHTTAGPRPLPPLGATREVPLPDVLDVTLASGLRVLAARTDGRARSAALIGYDAALAWWAYLELASGANAVRRVLGAVVLGSVVARVVRR